MHLTDFLPLPKQEKKGVLVLSEFAGAAQALGAGALLVNPYNTDEVASALHEALNMPLQEREQRFDYMFAHINQHTAQTWAEKFVGSLRHARQASNYDSGPFSGMEESSELPHREVIASYKVPPLWSSNDASSPSPLLLPLLSLSFSLRHSPAIHLRCRRASAPAASGC